MLAFFLLHRIQHLFWSHIALDLVQIRLGRQIYARSLGERTDDVHQSG